MAALAGFALTPGNASEEGNSLEIKHEYFQDNNGVWNHTPVFHLKRVLADFLSVGWEQEVDVVTGASRRLGSGNTGITGDGPVDAISGASKIEFRHSEKPAATLTLGNATATASLYSSRENDYFALGPAASLAWDFNDRNTTVALAYSRFFDEFRPEGEFAGLGGRKRISNYGLSVSQLLSPLTLVGITANLITSRGYLGHPYTPPMDSSGALRIEVVPAHKDAAALSGQLIQGFRVLERMGSVNLDLRWYQDEWELRSGTADLRLSQHLSDATYIVLRGRLYRQSGAFFAKDAYAGDEVYRTADIRLFSFSSWLAGFKISSAFPESWEDSKALPDRWEVKFDRLSRDTHGDPRAPLPAGSPRRRLYQLYGPEETYSQFTLILGLLFNL